MAFDFDGAIKEGYTASEIADHMKFDYQSAIAEGYTDDEILAHLKATQQKPTRAEESSKQGGAILDAAKKGVQNVTGGALGVADFIYGGVKAIPQAVMAAGAVLGGNKASDVEKYMMPEMAERTEELAPAIGKIAEKFGVPPEYATKSSGYKWMHDEPMASIGQALQLPGEAVRAVGGDEDLASGANIAVMGGLVGAPLAKGVAPKAPVNPLTTKSGLPFQQKVETPNNFRPAETVSVKAADAAADKYAAEQAAKQQKEVAEGPTLNFGEAVSDKALAAVDKQMQKRQRGVVAPQYDLQTAGVKERTLAPDSPFVNPALSEMVKTDTGAPYTRDLKAQEMRRANETELAFAEREGQAPKLTEDVWQKFDEAREQRATPLEPSQASPIVEPMIGGIRNRATGRQSGAVDFSLQHTFEQKQKAKQIKDKAIIDSLGIDFQKLGAMISNADNAKLANQVFGTRFPSLHDFMVSDTFKQLGLTLEKHPLSNERYLLKQDGKTLDIIDTSKGGQSEQVLTSLNKHFKDIQSTVKVGSGGTAPLGQTAAGKSQKGSIKFPFGRNSEVVTPEQIQQSYKLKYGSDMPIEAAIKLAKETNTQFENVRAKVTTKPGSTGADALAKKLGVDPFVAKETLTPSELKIALETGLVRDVDTNFVKKIINTGARAMGSSYGIRAYYNNPVLEAVMRPLSRAADAAKYKADHALWGKEGVGTLLNKLTEADMNLLWERMRAAVKDPNITADQIFAGLSPEAVAAGKALRKAYEVDLATKNAARAAEGKKPLTPEANHLASSWTGDRVSMVYDSKNEIKAVLTGYAKDIEVAKEWVRTNHPDWQITEPVARGKQSRQSGLDNLAELYDSVITAAEKGELSVQEAILKVMNDARVASSEKVRGTHLHEKFKKDTPVLGAEGYKPWLDRSKNAQDGFQAQVAHIEGSIARAELAEAAKTIAEYKKELGNLNAIKYAESKLRDMQGFGTWEALKMAEDSVRSKLSESTAGTALLKTYRGLNSAASAAMNLKFFAFDAAFGIINLLEMGTKTPPAILHGLKATALPWASKKTLETVAHINGAKDGAKSLTGDAKFFHDYAMNQNVGNPTVEVAGRVRPKTVAGDVASGAKTLTDATIVIPERVARYGAFTTTAHVLRAAGLDKVHAADLAHDLVKLYFKDYSPMEAAAIFQKTGEIGMNGGRQLRTWLLGEIMLSSAALANKQPIILGTALGLTALMYGADSVPLFKQMDEAMAWVRGFAERHTDDPKAAREIGSILTPREYLFSNGLKMPGTDFDLVKKGDPRGVIDRGMEHLGADGYLLGRTEWRAMPEGVSEVLIKVKFLLDAGMSWTQAVKEATRDDPDGAVLAKLLIEPFAPKMLTRELELRGLKTEGGNILSTGKDSNLSPTKTIVNEAEKKAYRLGMQPKTSGIQKYSEEMDFRKSEEVKAKRDEARNKLVRAYNAMQIKPEAKDAFKKAAANFIRAYGGADRTDESMKAAIEAAALEMELSPNQLKKLKAIKNYGNNFELNKFFESVTESTVKTRSGKVYKED